MNISVFQSKPPDGIGSCRVGTAHHSLTWNGGQCPPYKNSHADLWLLRFDAPWLAEAELQSFLAADEIARAERFSIEKPRRQFVIARGCLRYLLGCYLDRPPQNIEIRVSSGGKPHLANDELHFNVAHSGDICLIAVAARRIGIDVEQLRPMPNMAGLVQRFYSKGESRQFANLPEEHRLAGFFRGWTAKEALLKAVGVGLADLESCSVDLDPRSPARIVHFDHSPAAGQYWDLQTWMINDGYLASAAMEMPAAK